MGAAVHLIEKAAIRELVMRLPSVEAHAVWAPSYDGLPNPLVALERRVLSDLLSGISPRNVIDIGCGTGEWLKRFQERGARVAGLDACDAMLNEARRHSSLSGRLVLADARFLPFRDASADLVLCSLSLGYFENADAVFGEFARLCCPGAHVVVSDLHPDALAKGWTRSFKIGGVHYEIEHFRHSQRNIQRAACQAGLHPLLWLDVHVGESEFPIFEKAGKAEIFRSITETPALFATLWGKS